MHSLPGKTGKEKTVNARFKSLLFCFWITSTIFVCDRIFKIWAEAALDPQQSYPVLQNLFHLTLVHNSGAAFGLWRGARTLLILSTLLIILIFIGHLVFGREARIPRPQLVAWSLIMGGALGNLYDRVRFGYVIDYLDFRVWPVFNLADSAICVGVFWLVLSQLRASKP